MRERLPTQQAKALETMREVLRDDFLSLEVTEYELRESFTEGACQIVCHLVEKPSDQRFSIESRGVGMLDAFFKGVSGRYQPEHPSLETIRIASFSVRGLMGEPKNGDRATDAAAEATIGITNSGGGEFHFAAVSPSVSHSSLEAVLAAIEYFVNSERCYVRLYKALRHHETTGRMELVARYTELLSQMVRNTSYSSAVERLKRDA